MIPDISSLIRCFWPRKCALSQRASDRPRRLEMGKELPLIPELDKREMMPARKSPGALAKRRAGLLPGSHAGSALHFPGQVCS